MLEATLLLTVLVDLWQASTSFWTSKVVIFSTQLIENMFDLKKSVKMFVDVNCFQITFTWKMDLQTV